MKIPSISPRGLLTEAVSRLASSEPGGGSAAIARDQGASAISSRANPVAYGAEGSRGPWSLTVLQVLTRDAAGQLVGAASRFNGAAADGLTYVAVELRAVNHGARALLIDQNDFAVTGSSGLVRRFVGAIPPDPALAGRVEPGAALQGWIVGGARTDDANLLLLFDSVTISGSWADQTFALQAGASIADVAAPAMAPTNAGKRPDQAVARGDAAVTAAWAVKILDIVQGADVVGLFPAADYRTTALEGSGAHFADAWLAFHVQVTNNQTGGSSAYFPPAAFGLADGTGAPVPDVDILTPPDPDAAGYYFPGGTRDGWVVFEMPPDYSGATLRFAPFAGDEVRYLNWGADSPAAPAPSPAATVAAGASVVVSEDVVHLRAKPSTAGDIVTDLKRGDELTVTGDAISGGDFRWYPVTVAATRAKGFVVVDFVRPK